MIQAIVNPCSPAWYCKKCGNTHHILYMNGHLSYCYKCVPKTIKDQAVYMNQNRELTEYKEIMEDY